MYDECEEITCSPSELRFSQDLISARFRPPYNNLTVYDAVRRIINGNLDPKDFPKIRVMRHEGNLWCLDNRRLYVYKLARVQLINVSLVATGRSLRTSLYAFPPNIFQSMSKADFYPLVIWTSGVRSTLDSFVQMMRIWIPGYRIDCSMS